MTSNVARGIVRRVERFDNGCGLLRIDGFDAITLAADYVLGALTVLPGVEGLIVDLRRNGVARAPPSLLAEFLLGTGIEQLATVGTVTSLTGNGGRPASSASSICRPISRWPC